MNIMVNVQNIKTKKKDLKNSQREKARMSTQELQLEISNNANQQPVA